MTTYLDLTPEQRLKRAELTPKEKAAVDSFLAAARGLPSRICISIDDYESELIVQKRITSGSAMCVGKVKKKSLFF
jgi:hypothetical protein